MKLRRSAREKKPPQHLQDFQLELDPTESLQTRAIRDELNQVESLLESLTPEAKQSASANKLQTSTFTPEEEKQSAASISKLQNENLKLELKLTRAKIELARVKSVMAHESQSKMAAPNPTNINTQNQGQCTTQRATVPTLTALQSDTAVQEMMTTNSRPATVTNDDLFQALRKKTTPCRTIQHQRKMPRGTKDPSMGPRQRKIDDRS